MKLSSSLKSYLSERLSDEVLSIKELAHGAHNVNYTINCKNKKYLLRVYVSPQFDNIDKEYKVLKLLNGNSAPKVFFKDKSKKHINYNYLVEEFIEGKVKDKFSPKLLKLAAECLKKIHSIKRSTNEKVKPISDWTIKTLKKNDPSPHLSQDWSNIFSNACETVTKLLKSRSLKFSLLHDDPIAKNFIITRDDLILVDWEFVTYGDFVEDLAVMIVEDRLSKEHEQIFLESYGFGIKQTEYKIVLGHKIRRTLACIAWRAERINMMDKGYKHKAETIDNHIHHLRKEVEYLKSLF
jgi:aminoglycoside phosphotransferase (APT) family kinase protein